MFDRISIWRGAPSIYSVPPPLGKDWPHGMHQKNISFLCIMNRESIIVEICYIKVEVQAQRQAGSCSLNSNPTCYLDLSMIQTAFRKKCCSILLSENNWRTCEIQTTESEFYSEEGSGERPFQGKQLAKNKTRYVQPKRNDTKCGHSLTWKLICRSPHHCVVPQTVSQEADQPGETEDSSYQVCFTGECTERSLHGTKILIRELSESVELTTTQFRHDFVIKVT